MGIWQSERILAAADVTLPAASATNLDALSER
jgi:hypothetical protein